MKILILINSLNPGGAERQVVTDVNLLSRSGHDITLVFQKSGPLKKQLSNNIELYSLNSHSSIRSSLLFFRFLRKNTFDYVIAHMFWAHKVSALPSGLTGTKLILMEHGLGLWRKWYHIAIVQLISKIAQKIVCVSEAKRIIKIERENIPVKKLLVMPNSFNQMEVELLKKDKSPFPDDKFIIGFAGRFNAVKQIPLLIDLAIRLKTKTSAFLFVLLGEGNEMKNVKQLIQVNDLHKFFYLPGYIEKPLSMIQHLNAFILPSKREDLSVALIEAGVVGLPLIAFDVGGNAEIIDHDKGGFVIPPFDIELLKNKILYLIKNPEQAVKMGSYNKERILEKFSEEKRLNNLNSLFH